MAEFQDSKKHAPTPLANIPHMPALSPAQMSPNTQREVVVKALRDKANADLGVRGEGGQLELLVTGSIYRRCSTGNRKGNVSFSPGHAECHSGGGAPAADRD